jgi:hypothetical protein
VDEAERCWRTSSPARQAATPVGERKAAGKLNLRCHRPGTRTRFLIHMPAPPTFSHTPARTWKRTGEGRLAETQTSSRRSRCGQTKTTNDRCQLKPSTSAYGVRPFLKPTGRICLPATTSKLRRSQCRFLAYRSAPTPILSLSPALPASLRASACP